MGSGETTYFHDAKQRLCATCNYRRIKYNWLKVPGHVNSKHQTRLNGEDFVKNLTQKAKMHNPNDNDGDAHQELLETQLQYERVCTAYHNDCDNSGE